jgi:uncharacterized membrane protein (UPF0127 family)
MKSARPRPRKTRHSRSSDAYNRRLLRLYVREMMENGDAVLSEGMLINEGLGDDLKGILRDILKVALGGAAVVGTAGMGGDVLTDMLFAMESSADVISKVEEVTSGATEMADVITAAKEANIQNGSDAVYDAVLGVTQKLADTGEEAQIEAVKEAVDALVEKLANAIGEWVATALPDDAGMGGIALREAIEAIIGSGADDVYEQLKAGFERLPQQAKEFIEDPVAMEQFLNGIVDELVKILDGAGGEGGEGTKGTTGATGTMGEQADMFKKVAGAAVKGAVTLNPVMMLAKPKILEWLNGPLREMIAKGSQIPNILVTLIFGVTAFLQIVTREEYKEVPEESEAAKTVGESVRKKKTRIGTQKLKRIIKEEIARSISAGLIELEVGYASVAVEIADTPELRNQGLMHRLHLDDNCGMLFVYPDSAPRSFWMENTYIPLSIAYIDDLNVILSIQDMKPFDRSDVCSVENAAYALEMSQGWFEENEIVPGQSVVGLPGYSVM